MGNRTDNVTDYINDWRFYLSRCFSGSRQKAIASSVRDGTKLPGTVLFRADREVFILFGNEIQLTEVNIRSGHYGKYG